MARQVRENNRAEKFINELEEISESFPQFGDVIGVKKQDLKELVRIAKLDQQETDVDLAYLFYDKHKEKAESRKKYMPDIAFVSEAEADVARLIGNTIGGDNALSATLKDGMIEYGIHDYVKLHREPHGDDTFHEGKLYKVVDIEGYEVTVVDDGGKTHTNSPWMFTQASHREVERWLKTGKL